MSCHVLNCELIHFELDWTEMIFFVWPDKKKKANEQDGSGSEDEQASKGKKKRKTMTLKTDAEADDLDDETELLYLQAIEAKGDQPDDEDDQIGKAAPVSVPKPLKIKVELESPRGPPAKRTGGATGRGSAASCAPPRKAVRGAEGGKAHSVAGHQAIENTALAQAQALQLSQMTMTGFPHANAESEKDKVIPHSSWKNVQTFMADALCEKQFAPPSKYKKDTQVSKWKSEVEKARPYMSLMERLFSTDGGTAKWKEQEVKNALKHFAKYNAKLDKKLEYEAAAATSEEPPLSARMAALKEALDALKNVKELAIAAGKSGTIDVSALRTFAMKVQGALQKLIGENYFVGFPMHWVQARRNCGTNHNLRQL